jgi:hypothetical protein
LSIQLEFTMTESVNHFARLSAINVSEHIERKAGYAYISWPFAVAQLRLADPSACWEVRRFGGLPYLMTETGFFAEVAVTVQGITLSQIHPVLDGRNRVIMAPTAFDVNSSIQRALVKAIALHGLGLYIYAGEDLPQIGTEPAANDEGKNAGAAPTEPTKLPASPAAARPSPPGKPVGKTITVAQQATIRKLAVEVDVEMPRLLEYYGVRSLGEIQVADFLRVVRSLEKRRAA